MSNLTFYLRRIHSFTGIFCLNLFLLEHIFTNSSVLAGPAVFNASVAILASIPTPVMLFLEICVIAPPFLFHAIYGAYIARQARNNIGNYPYMQNIQFALQRWTAWYLLIFLVWHVGYFRFVVKGSGVPLSYELVAAYLSNPVYWLLYLLGMWAAIFHLTNGITTAAMTWGIAKGPRIQRVINYGSMALCAILCIVSLAFMLKYL